MSSQILETEQVEATYETQLVTGKPLRRKEDPRLLIGGSKYVDDIRLPYMLYGAVLRSTYAHAVIRRLDVSEAANAIGVKLVLTADDLPTQTVLRTIPTSDGVLIRRPVLAAKEVSFVGEPIAFVVAESRQCAEDAIELIKVEYEVLEALISVDDAMKENSPPSHLGLSSNVAMVDKLSSGDVDSAFMKASKVVSVDYLNQRLAPCPIEPRASLASFQKGDQSLTIWISTQGPFDVKSTISKVLNHPESTVRVIAPEVGGGFGAKLSVYPEDVLVCLASMKLDAPVKWIESRTENFLSMTHGRGQRQHVELAADQTGKILGMRVKLIGDAGCYLTGDSSDVTLTLKMISGCYVIPAFEGEAIAVFTNKCLHDAYRGAARPEAIYAIERAMDELSRELGMDPAELRLRNFIPSKDFPYKTVSGFLYDSGDYVLTLRKVLEYSNYYGWKEEQKRAKAAGRLIGIGIASYVEICGFDPDSPQTASMFVSPSGKVSIVSGTFPHGQGHETPFAQIAADVLGVDVDSISVSYGDTAQLPWGTFTAGSRSAALGGTAVQMSARKIRDKMIKIAARKLGVDEEDILMKSGEVFSSRKSKNRDGSTPKLTFEDVASLAYKPSSLPEGMEPGLFSFSAFAPPECTFPFGTHVAVVEIEKETGQVKILDYVSVDDCGNVINPLVFEGQVHGGVVQGLGQALLEVVKYDHEGQLLTTSFLDYQIPLAEDIPPINNYRTVTPTSCNPLGVKGVGEVGTIAAPPAIMNAVADVLSMIGASVTDMPATPEYVKSLIKSPATTG